MKMNIFLFLQSFFQIQGHLKQDRKKKEKKKEEKVETKKSVFVIS